MRNPSGPGSRTSPDERPYICVQPTPPLGTASHRCKRGADHICGRPYDGHRLSSVCGKPARRIRWLARSGSTLFTGGFVLRSKVEHPLIQASAQWPVVIAHEATGVVDVLDG